MCGLLWFYLSQKWYRLFLGSLNLATHNEVKIMYAEITKSAFKKIVADTVKAHHTEELEHARKVFYWEQGIELMEIENYLSSVNQYYILDINS